ncbi:assimilatory nitrate reductase (NADH) alpha subunit apoprotein [Yoonia tamlensis]|uniref:Assimilatory nitrate reductase (NADH) alpha subunit apoprotein n=1 Tax=Yoonia tamlensis TaxID=390270 RepID=A0A1I6FVK3_9RHOB|nr:nitrate reductase [Yoonia tamlensis]SFR33982.1 assimilatory nitrate reductase (NADH) alpha subunit apoprotein [Yoonia tamlensis]
MTGVKTTCPYCGVGCGVIAKPDGTIKGDPDHPANYGRLCSKGSALGETIDLDGRLLAPQILGRSAGWNDALDLVATKFSAAIRDHGPDSVAFYVSGQLLTEDYYVANKLMKGYIGSANIDTNSRLCMASSVAGHKRAFGTDTVPGTYEDLEQADLIVLVGSNLAWCHPVLFQRISAAKDARPEMRIVNIDPRKTATSDLADLHLQINADGDAALFNGLLRHLADTDALDQPYIDAHVNGFDAAIAAAAGDPTLSGLTADEIAQFYALWAGTKKVVTVYSQGVNQSTSGTDKVNAIINCHLATGRIGKPGMGPFSVTGQPNAMGGREVGGLANMLANHLDIENPDHRDAVQTAWSSPTICTKPGLKAVDLFQACADGKIKALWIISTNPAVSLPDADGVSAAIKNVPFTVVTDIMARTDTGDLADVLLPATGWGEKNGTVTNSERRISRQRAFLPAPAHARPDWKIICDVAQRMGFDGFGFETPADVFAEYVATTALSRDFGKDLDLTALDGADYESLEAVQWPVGGKTRFFADGGFYHPDGKARMIAVTPPAQSNGKFILNTGRNRDQWHTMTRTGKSARLGAHLAEPYVEIHPDDAAEMGVDTAELVTVYGPKGKAIFRALITTNVGRGSLFAPLHWTRQQSASGVVNSAIGPRTDPISGQPATKSTQVDAGKCPVAWYGFAVSANAMQPSRPYHAIAKTGTGWQAECAGMKAPHDWELEARNITATKGGDAAVLHDAATGDVRVAIIKDNKIAALFFASTTPVVVARQHAASLIGTDVAGLAALAGRAAADMPDPGATVCACFNVGVNTLRDAIGQGANTVAALGKATCAGTNCGSCKPELAALIAQFQIPVAAE